MIDWDRVSQLKEEVGEEDFKEVVDIFLDEVKEELETLTPELSAETLEAKMHFLKGAALNLGLKDFASICRTGEDLARTGQANAVDISEVLTCYRTSIKEFLTVVDEPTASA